MKKYNIAIVGATGLVGQTFLKILEEYDVPLNELRLFASPKSKGKMIKFKGKDYTVKSVEKDSFKDIDYALFSAGADVSKTVALQAVSEGAVVIDNSSAFRMDKTVPLVVPEINIKDAYGHKLIANPNCSTIQAVLPLYALNNVYGITEVEYTTYQAVSGSGYKGLKDLESGEREFYPYDIKKTCIPEIGDFTEDGYTTEEHKMMNETRKILHLENLFVSATCVRVPVAYSHAVNVRVKLMRYVNLEDVKRTLAEQKGIKLLDDIEKMIYPTGIDSTGTDLVYIGRIRRDKIDRNTILLYVVADNVRKGAASNAVQIMKGLMEHVDSR